MKASTTPPLCPACKQEMKAVTSRTPEGAWECWHCASALAHAQDPDSDLPHDCACDDDKGQLCAWHDYVKKGFRWP